MANQYTDTGFIFKLINDPSVLGLSFGKALESICQKKDMPVTKLIERSDRQELTERIVNNNKRQQPAVTLA